MVVMCILNILRNINKKQTNKYARLHEATWAAHDNEAKTQLLPTMDQASRCSKLITRGPAIANKCSRRLCGCPIPIWHL